MLRTILTWKMRRLNSAKTVAEKNADWGSTEFMEMINFGIFQLKTRKVVKTSKLVVVEPRNRMLQPDNNLPLNKIVSFTPLQCIDLFLQLFNSTRESKATLYGRRCWIICLINECESKIGYWPISSHFMTISYLYYVIKYITVQAMVKNQEHYLPIHSKLLFND